MTLTSPALPDLAQLRHLSEQTMMLCNVRAVGADHAYGAGWLWDTVTLNGIRAERWKSVNSTKPPNAKRWSKYLWHPKKPEDGFYFDPDGNLGAAVKAAFHNLFIVGGEIAAMSMFDGGFRNTTCFFGDETIPIESFVADLTALGVQEVIMIPDRDNAGLKCATTVRDILSKSLDIGFTCYALPYPLEDKHGKDVNDWWIDLQQQGATLTEHIDTLPLWRLPEPKPNVIDFPLIDAGNKDLPPRFIEAVLRDVEARADPNKAFRWGADGWSTNFRCPFHDDQQASAGFNRESMSFKCFACGKKSAKEYGEGVGLMLRDFYDAPVPTAKPTPAPTTAPQAQKAAAVGIAPPLPIFAQLTGEQLALAATGRDWLDTYLEWAVDASPLTPRSFHEAMAIWLLATTSTRRIHVRIGAEDIYPNLYILIVGKTTIYRKSTAMKLVKSVLYKANMGALLLPSEATPEALFDELAGVKPLNFETLPEETRKRWLLGRSVAGQRSFMKDEASSIFASMKRDYMAGLSELLLQGYDGDGGEQEKRLKSKGITTIRDLCLSFLGATTPVMYSKYVGTEENENGFAARFAIITPERDLQYRDPADFVEIPASVIARLRHMFVDVLPWHDGMKPGWSTNMLGEVVTPPSTFCTFDPEALKQLNEYRKALGWDLPNSDKIDESKFAHYARIGTMAFKVAMLFAAIDAQSTPVRIEARHAYAAQLVCEDWRESLHRLDRDIAKAHTSDGNDNKVLALIRESNGRGVTIREIMQQCNIKTRKDAVDALTLLADDGLIEQYNHKPEGRGRPTVYYRLIQESKV